jgi:hypothetical protein
MFPEMSPFTVFRAWVFKTVAVLEKGVGKRQFTTWSMFQHSEAVGVRSESADSLGEEGSDGGSFTSIPLRWSKLLPWFSIGIPKETL